MDNNEVQDERANGLPNMAEIVPSMPNLVPETNSIFASDEGYYSDNKRIINNSQHELAIEKIDTSVFHFFAEQQKKTLETISNLALESLRPSLTKIQDVMRTSIAKNYSEISQAMEPYAEMQTKLQELFRSIAPIYFRSSRELPRYYSSEMTSPSDFFDPKSGRIESIEDLNNAILLLQQHASKLPLYWRGQKDASWGLHSKLFRQLMKQNGVIAPEERPKTKQPYPTEDQMIQSEKRILSLARQDWRYGNLSALEIFARIQHFGGPTRLLDASCNPYIAAWFAVYDPTQECGDCDGRLFALAGHALGDDGQLDYSEELLRRDPFWFNLHDYEQRAVANWGTGSRRIVWRPPVYESRIAAQNAVFILDGVPITNSKILKYFRKPKSTGYWKRPDILAASSIYAKPFSPEHNPRPNQYNLAPTYSFVIDKKAKKVIRNYLEDTFGYRESFIYPDFEGLANRSNNIQFPCLAE